MPGKELSLEDLANSAKKSSNVTSRPAVSKPVPNMGAGNTPTANRPMSVSDLTDNLRKTGVTPEKEKTVDAPVVKDAFESMTKTLNDRKRRIEEEFMPIVEANAHDMAMAKATGTDIENTKLGAREESYEVAFMPENAVTQTANVGDAAEPEIDLEQEIANENDNGAIVEAAPEVKPTNVAEKKPDPAVTHSSDELKVSQMQKEEPKPVTPAPETSNKNPNVDGYDEELDALMKDLQASDEDDDITDDSPETPEETRARLKEQMGNIKVAQDPIDLSKFSIRSNPISINSVLSTVDQRTQGAKKADWVLYNSGRCVTFSECRGTELDVLRRTINNSNNTNGVVAALRFIYEHIVDANKPPFEAWTKLIRTEDMESMYFGIYRACFSDNNLLPRTCNAETGCNKQSLVEMPIKDMVKFENDEVKQRFDDLYRQDTTTDTHTFESTVMQISDDFAVSYSPPTLYSTYIQFATLKPEILEKYNDQLNSMAFIDGFYYIDRATNSLEPIAIRQYPNNINKTVLSKLKVYVDILKRLNSDQYNLLVSKLMNSPDRNKVTYVYPECKCPECGTTIPEETCDMLSLLFMRAQLAQIKNL